jgi:hypothetical protein
MRNLQAVLKSGGKMTKCPFCGRLVGDIDIRAVEWAREYDPAVCVESFKQQYEELIEENKRLKKQLESV